MIDKVVIASNNQGKIKEFKDILGSNIKLFSLKDLNINMDIKETGATFEENAYIKAETIYNMTKIPTIADDSGLLVDYLSGAPGVMSARYAGEGSKDEENIKKLLNEMKGVKNTQERKAKFICSIIFIISLENEKKDIIRVNGECLGKIAFKPIGTNGFGYDSIFVVNGKTFAQISEYEKNQISHRGVALRKLKKIIEKREDIWTVNKDRN